MYKPFNGDTNWASFNEMVNDRQMDLNVPTFGREDFRWQEGRPDQLASWTGYKDLGIDDSYWSQMDDAEKMNRYEAITGQAQSSIDRGRKAGWDFTDEARNRLKAGGWDLNSTNNIRINTGRDAQGEIHGGNAWDTGDPNINPLDRIGSISYKNSRSTALNYRYVTDPKTGRRVPVKDQGANWITNNGSSNRQAAIAIGGLALGAAGGALAGAAGAGASAAGTGASQTASTLSQIAQYSQMVNQASKIAGLYGQATGNERLSRIAGLVNAASGVAGGVSGGINAGTSGNWINALKSGYGAYKSGTSLQNQLNRPEPRPIPQRPMTRPQQARPNTMQRRQPAPNYQSLMEMYMRQRRTPPRR